MGDPATFWLMVANLALAAVVVACLATTLLATLFHLIARARTRARISNEIECYLRGTLEHRQAAHTARSTSSFTSKPILIRSTRATVRAAIIVGT
jgi:C4-dicarboxylate-specific signal transduction histidine kinase